ncbi:hypothetical protein SAMN04487760_102218 [Lachnospiraceae bacterium G41]|jgi:hypothetical protein|nr:hypothetical protein SAMN04487760_102218 [Lachnospiraceae bacterium G41]
MDEKDSKRLKSIYVGQIIDRVILILVFFLLIGNLVGTIYLGVQIKNFANMLEPALEVLNDIDVEGLNKTISTLNNAVDVFKINETLDAIAKLDFDGFSKVLNGIDVDKLNTTLEKIDDAAQFMKRIGDGMNNFLNQFGINIGK